MFCFFRQSRIDYSSSGAFAKFGLKHSFINPEAKTPDYSAKATICSSQTFRRRLGNPEWIGLFHRPKTIVMNR